MRVNYKIIGESKDAYKVITKMNIWNASLDEKTWIPKSVCEIEEKYYRNSSKKYKVVVWVDDWFYNKYL